MSDPWEQPQHFVDDYGFMHETKDYSDSSDLRRLKRMLDSEIAVDDETKETD